MIKKRDNISLREKEKREKKGMKERESRRNLRGGRKEKGCL